MGKSNNKFNRWCRGCQRTFTTTRKHPQRYCSPNCRHLHKQIQDADRKTEEEAILDLQRLIEERELDEEELSGNS